MYILILLGMVIVAFGINMLIQPEASFELARRYFPTSAFQYGCGIVGLLLGVALFFSSSASKYPTLFEVVAILSLIGGAICIVLPSSTFRSIVSWELSTFSPHGRLLAVCYFVTGGFTIYAAL